MSDYHAIAQKRYRQFIRNENRKQKKARWKRVVLMGLLWIASLVAKFFGTKRQKERVEVQ